MRTICVIVEVPPVCMLPNAPEKTCRFLYGFPRVKGVTALAYRCRLFGCAVPAPMIAASAECRIAQKFEETELISDDHK